MPGYFEPTGGGSGDGGAAIALDEGQISALRNLAVQLLERIGPDRAAEAGEDPLDALFAEGPSEPPKDPALARLFPDGYGQPGAAPDEETRRLAAEFRRFTETELRARKREDLLAMVHALDAVAGEAASADTGGAVLTLKPEECKRWLGALNDLRLAIAAQLDIRTDEDADLLFARPAQGQERALVLAYSWLGGLQESLLSTLLP